MLKKTDDNLVIGVDFGTSGVRAVVVDTADGSEQATSTAGFPRWNRGDYCDPALAQYRQHPQELIEAFKAAVTDAVNQLTAEPRRSITAIGIDTTGSTPLPVDKSGTPLGLLPEFERDPDAQLTLWKDRSAWAEADEITERLQNRTDYDYLEYCGGSYSAEWYWAKALRTMRKNTAVAESTYTWVEHADWFPALLTDQTAPRSLVRSRCAAAHKALWHSRYGGYPAADVFAEIDPALATLRRTLPDYSYTADNVCGGLSNEWAGILGLESGIKVACGVFDAHSGALGAGVGRGTAVKVIGTSSSEMIVADPADLGNRAVPGVESQAEGSMIPELIGLEAGQPAFGDILEWFAELLAYGAASRSGSSRRSSEDATSHVLARLSKEAAERTDERYDPVTLDWFNGRRAPFANNQVSGLIGRLSLGTDAVSLFASLVKGLAFGTRRIHEHLRTYRVPVEAIIAVGGIPRKSPYVVQTLADVLGTDIFVCETDHASARGAAILAAAAGGQYGTVAEAVENMRSPFARTYSPNADRRPALNEQYALYCQLAEAVDPTSR